MTKTLTIISGAGVMMLALLPVLFLHRLYSVESLGGYSNHGLAARAFVVSLVVIGVSISGAMALIVIRLYDRYFRG